MKKSTKELEFEDYLEFLNDGSLEKFKSLSKSDRDKFESESYKGYSIWLLEQASHSDNKLIKGAANRLLKLLSD